MNQNVFFLGLSCLLLLLVIGVMRINMKRRLKFSKKEKVMIVMSVPLIIYLLYSSINGFVIDKRYYNESMYRAYKSITVESNKALSMIRAMEDVYSSSGDVEIAKICLLNKNGDYQRAAKEIEKLEKRKLKDTGKTQLAFQKAISYSGMGRIEEAIQIVKEYPENKLSTSEVELKDQAYLKNQVIHFALELSNEYRDKEQSIENIVKKEELKDKIDHLSDLEAAKSDLKEMIIQAPKDLEAKKLLLQVKTTLREYNDSIKLAQEIIRQENTLENKIKLSNIYLQQAKDNVYYDTEINGYLQDANVKGLERKKKKLELSLEKLNQQINSLNSEKNREKVQREAEEVKARINKLEEEIEQIPIRKVMNYLAANKPLFKSAQAPYYLQMSKLQFLMNESEAAKKTLEKFSKVAEVYRGDVETIETYRVLKNLIDQPSYQKSELSGTESIIKAAVETVGNAIKASNVDISIDQEFQNYLVSYIKYGKVQLDIRNIDVSNYPEIKANISIGGDKKGLFSRYVKFDSSDFAVEDTFVDIDNIHVLKNENMEKHVVLTLDTSGSMEGPPLYHSKEAAMNFIEKVSNDLEVSILSFSDSVEVQNGFTRNKNVSKNSINGLTSDGGTNIYSALTQALSELDKVVGSKVVILFTDGRDGSSSTIAQAIEEASDKGIPVYTIGLGDVDAAYLSSISNGTGGKFFSALNSNELNDIYDVLQKQIQNDYTISYRIKNEGKTDRYITADLTKMNGSGYKEYSIGVPNTEVGSVAGDESEFIIDLPTENIFSLTGIKTNYIAIDSISKNTFVNITGNGFKGGIGIKVHNLDAAEVKIIDENNLSVRLPSNLQVGTYDVYGVNDKGEVSTLKQALSIVHSDAITELKIGDYVIKANFISTENNIDYYCRGNVIINDFIRVNGDLKVKKYSDRDGTIIGDSKLYVTFNKNRNKHVAGFMKSNEYMISNGSFEIDVASDSAMIDGKTFNSNILFFKSHISGANIYKDKVMLMAASFELDETLYGKVEDSSFLKNHKKIDEIIKEKKLLEIGINKDLGFVVKAHFNVMGLKLPLLDKLGKTSLIVDMDTEKGAFELEGEASFDYIEHKAFKIISGMGAKFVFKSFYMDEFELAIDTAIPISAITTINGFKVGGKNITGAKAAGNWRKARASIAADIGFGVKVPLLGQYDIITLEDTGGEFGLDFKDLILQSKVKLFNNELAEGKVRLGKDFYVTAKGNFELNLFDLVVFGSAGEFRIENVPDGAATCLYLLSRGSAYYDLPMKDKFEGQGSTELFFKEQLNIYKVQAVLNNESKTIRIIDRKNEGLFKRFTISTY